MSAATDQRRAAKADGCKPYSPVLDIDPNGPTFPAGPKGRPGMVPGSK
jgi:hypothetical protein